MISEEEAVNIAKKVAETNGWLWLGDTQLIKRGWFFKTRNWTVLSNADMIGCNVWVEIDSITGAVVSSGFSPR